MKKIWLVLLIVVGWWVYAHRTTLYVRDPLGTVSRNGSVELGPQVYVNYFNDVLLSNDHLPSYLLVVQHGQPVGVPVPVHCLFSVLCVAQGYPVPQLAPLTGAPATSMTPREVRFTDENGREVVVKLR